MMLRSFHPIGQGAFYTEQFKGFTAVYDCGSDNGVSIIQNEIRSVFKKSQTIDALFISHFDADHVNGLEFLLTHCNVKKVFLPLINDTEKTELIIHHSVTDKLYFFLELLISDPVKAVEQISNYTQVVLVEPVRKSIVNDLDRKEIDIEEISDKFSYINSGDKIYSRFLENWVFVPFNFQSSKRSTNLATKLHKNRLDLTDVESFKICWCDPVKKKLIFDSYKSISGGFNSNSMTLYSGPANKDHCLKMIEVSQRIAPIPYHPICSSKSQVGCLYLGDYDANSRGKWNELNSKYKPFWEHIGTIQIPHHGSSHNYNDELNKNGAKLSVISCGSVNKYRHPHSSTIYGIVMNDGTPIIVNETVGSRAQFIIKKIIKSSNKTTIRSK